MSPATTKPSSEDVRSIPSPVVITGAAGGLGSATAMHLAELGVPLALFDRATDQLSEVEKACAATGTQVLALGMDQTDDEQVESGIGSVVEHFGGIGGLFANAGYGQFAPFLRTTAKAFRRHVDVNLQGTFSVCQNVAHHLVEQDGGGAMVLTASSGSHTYADQLFSYCATKAAIAMMGTGMASELGVHRIRVNVISPGVIETPMTSSMLDDPVHRNLMTSETPVGRLGAPGDVASLVTFLLSEEAAFITGANIPIDGGQTIHGYPRWFRLDYAKAHTPEWTIPR